MLIANAPMDDATDDAQRAAWHHAVNTRDPMFDGVFVVALTSTRVYCRSVCPSPLARPEHRRFFTTWTAAAAQGYRACLRCRPDLHATQAPLAAMARLADTVVERIAHGALDTLSVQALATTLGTTDRHVRRALKRMHKTTPARLAILQRLRTATALLADSQKSISSVALESGFRSIRRFNAAFREHYGMTPSAWRIAEARAVQLD